MTEQKTTHPTKYQDDDACGGGFGPPVMDENRYAPLVKSLDMDRETERAFLETLWNLLITIADLRSDFDPVPSLFDAKGDFSKPCNEKPVNFEGTNTRREFECAASRKAVAHEEEA